jgi:predicted PurR-regulated permease PerM
MTIIVGSLISQGAQIVQRIQEGGLTAPPTLSELFDKLPPWAQRGLDTLGIGEFDTLRDRLASALRQISQFLAGQALNVGQDTLRFIASLGIMLYVLFFLFRDGPRIGRDIRLSLPFSLAVSDALIARFAEVVRATVKGNVIIATLQGTIGGVTFWLLGIPGALVWGAVMVFLSLLPAIGAALVWAPWALYLIVSGDWLSGGILVFVGVAVIGLVDNLLRPPLVGNASRLPDYVVLVSTLGGLALFGINGFVIGPLIAALFVACWTLFRDARAGETKPSVG